MSNHWAHIPLDRAHTQNCDNLPYLKIENDCILYIEERIHRTMIPPVRCFTCGRVIADQYDYYIREVQKLQNKADESQDKPKTKKQLSEAQELRHFDGVLTGPIMDKLGLKRYCCRRMMLGIQDMMDTI